MISSQLFLRLYSGHYVKFSSVTLSGESDESFEGMTKFFPDETKFEHFYARSFNFNLKATQLAPLSSTGIVTSMGGTVIKSPYTTVASRTELPAQRETLQLIIIAVVFRFAVKQRKNAYYRNDPKKYGRSVTPKKF